MSSENRLLLRDHKISHCKYEYLKIQKAWKGINNLNYLLININTIRLVS